MPHWENLQNEQEFQFNCKPLKCSYGEDVVYIYIKLGPIVSNTLLLYLCIP